jgi:hypothetical protein
VTSFKALRVGMIVRIKGGIDGRYFLLKLEPYELGPGDVFAVLPNRAPPPRRYVLSPEAVRRRIVYRIVDPLLDAKPVTRAKELAR